MHGTIAADRYEMDALIEEHDRIASLVRKCGNSAEAARFVALSARPVMAAPYPSNVVHPLNPPSVTGTTISLDLMLDQPTRITRMIMDISLQRFFVDRVFTSAGGVTGGAVIFDVVAGNDIYADRDVQRVQPGAEFPEITFSRRAPGVATVEKWGGKFRFTDENRDRQNTATFTRATRQLTNTIVRKINQRGVSVLQTAVTANGRTIIGNDWSTIITGGASMSNASLWPAADFAAVAMQADVEELGITFDLWILNPQEYFQLATVYGDRLNEVLGNAGISIFVTNRQPAGEALVVSSGDVGEMRVEQPLGTETWRDANGKQQTWIQSSVRPLMFVDNPFAVLEVTGLAG